MKKLILLLLAVLMYSCENNNIEIIKNYDSEYYEVTDYEIIVQNLIPEETKTQMNKEVNEIFSKTNCEVENKPQHYLYKFYIGQSGEIKKIEIPSNFEQSENSAILDKIEKWKFGKFVTDGKAKE